MKAMEQEKDTKAATGHDVIESLALMKSGRREVLDNLVIRPNLVGRKTIG